jgi:hypothetical protein
VSTEIRRFRKRPVEIEAMQWTGRNLAEMKEFAPSVFSPNDPEDRPEDPDITAEVYDNLHSTWVGVHDGDWVIRGIRGEFYPCRPDVFAETYEPVGED